MGWVRLGWDAREGLLPSRGLKVSKVGDEVAVIVLGGGPDELLRECIGRDMGRSCYKE